MTVTFDSERPCPCGSGRPFGDCCGRFMAGAAAPTAEALMRSRYTAFVLGDEDYLLRTWHRSSRPDSLGLGDSPVWIGLEIRSSEAGGSADEEGTVEFVARYIAGGRQGTLRENSRFLREEGRWYYLDGDIREAGEKAGRNDPCPCGSGRKFKRCCGG